MRIAQLLPYDADYHGGVREVVVHLSRALERQGHEATIFGPTAKDELELDFHRLIPIRRTRWCCRRTARWRESSVWIRAPGRP